MATGLGISLRSDVPHTHPKHSGDRKTSGSLHRQEGPKPGQRDRWDVCGVRGRVMRASQQQVEVSQQRVDVSERSAPKGEGGKLGQEVLQRERTTGRSERNDAAVGRTTCQLL